MRLAAVLAVTTALAACGQPEDPTATASTEASSAAATTAATPAAGTPAQLHEKFDCLRTQGATLVIGHRGGPTRDYPENAIETLERTLKAGTRAMEVDIAATRDGQLVLMHDDTLERTTTGEGAVADLTLAEIQAFDLETGSKKTTFKAPTLEAALEWAVRNNAVLELDKKRSTDYAPILAAVEKAGAQNHVIVITYNDDQAIEVHKAAPHLVISATIDSVEHLDRLAAAGVKPDRLLAWTGNTEPRPELWKALGERGVESIFGTNGARDFGLDYRFWDDDDGAEYNDLVAGGLPLLVTGYSDKVTRQLGDSAAKAERCNF